MQYMTIVLGWEDIVDAELVQETLAGALEELVSVEGMDLGVKVDYEIHVGKLIDSELRDEAVVAQVQLAERLIDEAVGS